MEWAQHLLARAVTVGPMTLTDSDILPVNGEGNEVPEFLTDELVPQIANFLLGAVLSVSVIMIIVGGIMFIYSAGDQEKRTKGRDFIIYSLMGVVIAMLAYAVVQIVLSIDYMN